MKKVTRNYILNLCYNILILLVPLVTTPYISRVLGAEPIGIYNYCLSISTYFIVAGTLGLPLYGRREIAYIRDSREKLNSLFSELITLQFILIGAACTLFICFSFIYHRYTLMLLTCGVGIVAAMFDVSWLYIGLEDFTTIVTRGVLFKIVSVAMIFIFVKSPEDMYIYGLSIMLANFVGNVWMFVLARKRVAYYRPSLKKTVRHIQPALLLLLPNVVTTIYAVIDKTLLGALSSNMSEVGYYEQSQKIITLSLTLVTSLGTILMPRIASLFSKDDNHSIEIYIEKGIRIIVFIAIPLSIGLFLISDNLVPWFYGPGFGKVKILLKVFAPMLFFMGISDLLGTQVMIASKMEKKLFAVNVITCLINIMLDIILIPTFLSIGAAVATLIAEMLKTIICYVLIHNQVSLTISIGKYTKYCIAAVIMAIVVYSLAYNVLSKACFVNTAIMIISGALVYFSVLLILHDDLMYSARELLQSRIRKQ